MSLSDDVCESISVAIGVSLCLPQSLLLCVFCPHCHQCFLFSSLSSSTPPLVLDSNASISPLYSFPSPPLTCCCFHTLLLGILTVINTKSIAVTVVFRVEQQATGLDYAVSLCCPVLSCMFVFIFIRFAYEEGEE